MKTIGIQNASKLFFTSDLHFDHFNIARFCKRPYESRQEMNDSLIENWNSIVPKDGIVIVCGDFGFIKYKDINRWKSIREQLNGKIHFVRGNHDDYPLKPMGDDLFESVVDILNVVVDKKIIVCSHYPLLVWRGDFNAFGHVHTSKDGIVSPLDREAMKSIRNDVQYDVGVDQNNYRPITYIEFLKRLGYDIDGM